MLKSTEIFLISATNLLKTPKKVMAVDDEVKVVTTIQEILQSCGYTTGCFIEPDRAIKEIRSKGKDYALVITDIRMPDMNGFEFARSIRQTNPDIPIVFMTSFEISKSEFSLMFPSAPVADLITKPFNKAELLGVVRKYLGVTEQH
jgi:CheY-like chemotaxis protein